MSSQIPKPVRQLAAVALLCLAIAGLWFGVAAPLQSRLAALHEGIAEKRAVLGRFEDAARTDADALERAKTSGNFDLTQYVLAGESDALKASSLQAALTNIWAAKGLRFRSTRLLPPRDDGGVHLVAVEAGFEATIEQLQDVLLAIDAYRPQLQVTALRMSALPGVTLEPEQSGTRIDVQIEVAGPANVTGKIPVKG